MLSAVEVVEDQVQVGDSIDVLDHGFVRLDGCMADNLSVVNGARVSFASRVEEMTERDGGLVRFLMRERHGTPFEHNSFRFHVKCPIFVAREWMRHRVSSFNEWSGRYSQLEAEFYVPAAEDVRTQVGKPGSYTFDPVSDELAEETREAQRAVYEQAYATRDLLAQAWRRRSPATCCPSRSTRSSTGRSTPAA